MLFRLDGHGTANYVFLERTSATDCARIFIFFIHGFGTAVFSTPATNHPVLWRTRFHGHGDVLPIQYNGPDELTAYNALT